MSESKRKQKKRPYSIRDLARELCAREAGKAEVNIAQMNDVLHRLTDVIRERPLDAMGALTSRARRKS